MIRRNGVIGRIGAWSAPDLSSPEAVNNSWKEWACYETIKRYVTFIPQPMSAVTEFSPQCTIPIIFARLLSLHVFFVDALLPTLGAGHQPSM